MILLIRCVWLEKYYLIVQTINYGTLAKGLGIAYTHAHRGLRDVEITYEVYNKLRELAKEK